VVAAKEFALILGGAVASIHSIAENLPSRQLSFRYEVFSEAQFPVLKVLGNLEVLEDKIVNEVVGGPRRSPPLYKALLSCG